MSKNQIELAVLTVRDGAANCKILKGSKDKTILEKGLNSNPGYGYYKGLSIYEITSKIDWLINSVIRAISKC